MSYGVGHRRSSDLALLWLWCRLASAAPIRPLACKPSYAEDAARKKKKKKKERKKKGKHLKKTHPNSISSYLWVLGFGVTSFYVHLYIVEIV